MRLHPHDNAQPWARLRRFAFRGLMVQAFSIAIAVVLWLFTHGSFAFNMAYSLAIGNCSWLSIDLGMHLFAWARGRPLRERGPQWPGVPGIVLIVALGSVLGYTGGTTLVNWFTGLGGPSLFANRVAGITTVIAAVTMTYFFYTRERLQSEMAAAESARRLAVENQLKLLESQLEPHMLFNTLANLRVLIGLDPSQAQAMLDRLIAFLRATLNASRAGAHPLTAEFDRLADYLALMQVRMGARLQVQFELPTALREVMVPPLLLQPLVENAIKHGLEPKVEGGRIEVRARRLDQQLELTVRDTGIGLEAAARPSAGPSTEGTRYGTTHVRERLAALYGAQASFGLGPGPDAEGGTLARLCLPLPDTAASP